MALRIPLTLALVAFGAIAQPKPPLGLLTAQLRHWDGSWEAGSLHLTLDSSLEYQCGFDGRSFFERDYRRISIGALRPGDRLEIMTDRLTHASLCFARRVKVLSPTAAIQTSPWGGLIRATDHFAPRGNLTYFGLITKSGDGQLTLKTREGASHVILLRRDTRFFSDGAPSDAAMLAINGRVHVRAGLNLEDEVEAYQIIRGEILQPSGPVSRPK